MAKAAKDILYVDYIHQVGHVNFDHIHIDALKSTHRNVRLVLHKELADQLPYSKDEYAAILPSWLYQRDNRPFFNRLLFILTLLFIRWKIRPQKYRCVIVSSCEEITLGLFPLCRNMHIICHGNAQSFGFSKLKTFFLRRLARHNRFIVFNSEMAQPFLENGIKNVDIISHGCIPPFQVSNATTTLPDLSAYQHIVFHPSASPDREFMQQLLKDADLQDFLKRENILLILRNHPEGKTEIGNIRFINHYLTQAQYQQLFLQADTILLAYPPQFRFQVSGVSFECVSNHKKVLIFHNPSLNYCRQFYNYDPIFHNIGQMCQLLKQLSEDSSLQCVATAEKLRPDYTQILATK